MPGTVQLVLEVSLGRPSFEYFIIFTISFWEIGHFSDQLCTAGALGPHVPHLVKHNVFGCAGRQSMSLSACSLCLGWVLQGLCTWAVQQLCFWSVLLDNKFMQKAEWICYIKLALFFICLAAPMGFHLYLGFEQEAEGAAPNRSACNWHWGFREQCACNTFSCHLRGIRNRRWMIFFPFLFFWSCSLLHFLQ